MIPSLNRTPSLTVTRPIVLVGLMGVGKTTIGRRIASRLRLDFVDADAEIERSAGMSVADIFQSFGEDSFRDGERKVIERLLDGPTKVIATGGGAFIDEDTRTLIKETATSLWLRASLDLLVRRTSKKNTRPLLRDGNPREILGRLLEERTPIYRQANIIVDSVEGPHHRTVERAMRRLHAYSRLGNTL